MLCTAYSPFVFRLVNSKIPGTPLKKGKENVGREMCIRETEPVVWPNDIRGVILL